MAQFRFRRTLGMTFGGGLALVACLSLVAQNPPPPAKEAPAKQPAPPPTDPVTKLREELDSRSWKLQDLETQQARIKHEIETQAAAIRALAERLKEAERRRQADAAVPDVVGQRMQRLEQQVQALLKEVAALRQDRRPASKFVPLDLQPLANQKLANAMGTGRFEGNNLASLEAGEHRFNKVPFQIGDGLIQLGSTELADRPAKVDGIKVNRKVANLHMLHATVFYLEDEVKVGRYTVNYADGTTAEVPIVNAKDVSDFWKYPFSKEPTAAKVAWEGANEGAKQFNATLWLFHGTWTNPSPDKLVTSIDFSSTMETRCAPFCVAITAEE